MGMGRGKLGNSTSPCRRSGWSKLRLDVLLVSGIRPAQSQGADTPRTTRVALTMWNNNRHGRP